MQQKYWSEWENILSRWGLKSTAHLVLTQARPLLPMAAQLMILGLPIFKSLSLGNQYSALLKTMSDEEEIRQFSNFLKGVV
jgi:hypothetical protein